MHNWELHCRVVDNYGDVGVAWRLARALARRGCAVDLHIDDPRALAWMAPTGEPGVRILAPGSPGRVPDVVVECFGCGLSSQRVADLIALARSGRPVAWINLEYLSAEAWVEGVHGRPSPVHGGDPAGVHRWFFHPGFTPATGGLLREADLLDRQQAFDRAKWLREKGVDPGTGPVASLFCYEPACLDDLLGEFERMGATLLVAPGRGAAAARAARARRPAGAGPRVVELPWMTQEDFDHMLWASDLNLVRGEDSLVRALWAGKPFLWQAYPQPDGADRRKIEALLDWMQAPDSLGQAFRAWNGDGIALPQWDLPLWGRTALRAREAALAGDDLVTRLWDFLGRHHPQGGLARGNAVESPA